MLLLCCGGVEGGEQENNGSEKQPRQAPHVVDMACLDVVVDDWGRRAGVGA